MLCGGPRTVDAGRQSGVKLLFDHNLPPRLVRSLADLFPESRHVYALGLDHASDREICDFAQQHGYTVVTKDADFEDLALVLGLSLKVVWIRRGNCSTEEVESLLREESEAILAHGEDRQAHTLVLL